MNTNDSHQPPAYPVPPGWERFQPPPVVEPILQAVIVEDVAPPPQMRTSVWLRCWRQIGGGSLLLSIMVHVGLLLAAGVIIVGTQMAKPVTDFIPSGPTQASVKAGQDLEHKVSMKNLKAMARKTSQTRIAVDGPGVCTLPEGEMPLLSEVGQGRVCGNVLNLSGAPGLNGTTPPAQIAKLPNLFGGRCSMQSRLEKLRENGGTPECEMAVSRSLAWLKGQQNADGSWGRANKAAMTGLTLLCYLGRCETPDSAFYGDNVRNGMLYLVELARKNPYGTFAENLVSNSATYEHGIATYALGEMYSFYRLGSRSLPGLRETFEKGVKLIIEQQNPQGSWTYGGKEAGMPIAYNKDSRGEDLSVSGWQFQALKSAKHSGLKIEGLDAAIKRCCDYLESKQTKDGGFGKTNRDDHYNQWSLTGCGVLGLQTLAHNKATPVKKGIRFLREFLTSEPLDWERNCNLYCWYYYTQAFFQAGADDWKFYNAQFMPQVLGAQQPDGSFKRGRPNWPAGDAADPIYRQCLCTLQLEVYFRYLKVADREGQSIFEK
jgi:hypothetical protein